MLYKSVRMTGVMVGVFCEPYLKLGLQASDVFEKFYKAIQTTQHLNLGDLQTSGGASYADLKLTINTFGGGGRIDITPGAMIVELRDVRREVGYAEVAKEHLQRCEDTLKKAIVGVELKERLMRVNLWADCDGGAQAAEAFLAEKGNAALKLDQAPYATLKKEFTLRFDGLDVPKSTKIGFLLQRSVGDGNLFVQFDHTVYGSPIVSHTVTQQFEHAETDLQSLMSHVGLEPRREDGGHS
jgi:hypothetical protein